MLQPLEDLKVVTHFEENTNIPGVEYHEINCYSNVENYELKTKWLRSVGEMD